MPSTFAQDFSVERFATGLSKPVFLTAPPADTSRVFIVEQRSGTTGRIQLFPLPSGSATTFLSISPVATGGEQGLLGLAFHPNFAINGYFYVNYNDAAGDTNIVRYHANGDPPVADPASATTVLSISQPQSNHNGGWVAFGPDGYLYVATGDGGGSNDNDSSHTLGIGNAQDGTDNLLGKILRIDVDGDDFPGDATRNYAIPNDNPFVGEAFDDEIWALGLRNSWRPSFDRATGDLYIADVGPPEKRKVGVLFVPMCARIGLMFQSAIAAKKNPAKKGRSKKRKKATEKSAKLKVADIAAMESVSHRTVLNWIAQGVLRPAYRVGRVIRFTREGVERDLEEASK